MRTFHRLARPAGIALAAALALAPAAALLPTVSAQTGDEGGGQTTPLLSLIDSDRTTTLTINKIKGDPEVNGQAGEHNEPMPGIVFDVYQLDGMNPANAEDWASYAELDAATLDTEQGMTLADTVTTGADGTVTTKDLPVGFYFVKEQASNGVVPAPPFLISLPMTDQADLNSWDYHPTVKPKNQSMDLVKAVSDQDVIEGENLTYTLDGSVPAVATAGYSFDRYVITDTFASDFVQIVDSTHQVRLVDTAGNSRDVVQTLVRDTDYTVTLDGGDARMELTGPGLDKLAQERGGVPEQAGRPGLVVEWTFEAEVIGFNEEGAGIIPNTATLTPPSAPGVEVGEIPSNEVVTEMLEISLHKVDGDDRASLADATFDLYRCEPGSNDLLDATVLDTAETDATGLLSFKSVQVPDFADGAERTPEWAYCVVETKAPAGYELIPEPIVVDLAGLDAGTNTVTVEVENWESNGGNPLPVTGETALLWLAGGAGVILIGGVAYVMRRRANLDEVI